MKERPAVGSAGNNNANLDACALHAPCIARTTAQINVALYAPSRQRDGMTRETVNTFCATLPGATLQDPLGGGHDAWKVGGKICASIGTQGNGLAVKCASVQDALHLQDMFGWPKAPYFHRSWVFIPLDTNQSELRHRITLSYTLVRASLTKKAQSALPAMP